MNNQDLIDDIVKEDMHENAEMIIEKSGIDLLFAEMFKTYKDVSRYMSKEIGIDLELLQSIDYAKVVENKDLELMVSCIAMNGKQYSEEDILLLNIRSMFVVSWKMDIFFITHLKECAEANLRWNMVSRYFANRKVYGKKYMIYGMPYWLRNEQVNLLASIPEGYDLSEIRHIECGMIKTNDIQAHCKSQRDSRMIFMDYGVYVYLMEWIKMILCGYRVKRYNEESCFIEITEPVITCTNLFIVIVDILRNNGSVSNLPPSAMLFDKADIFIIKEIIMNQVDFMMAHEYGHILLKHKTQDEIKTNEEMEQSFKNEYEADNFALNWIRKSEARAIRINKEDCKNQKDYNNIQLHDLRNRKIEDIELLFTFFEMFDFVYQRILKVMDKEIKRSKNTHPTALLRRMNIKQFYDGNIDTKLMNYAEDFVRRMKAYMDSLSDDEIKRKIWRK
ncbi:hypothetical protein CSC2_29680 [Clostridium zeae]|uniref:IrrE N-terminal-like domain-containing protein n=1 Tax=Clostridium zeae TaxID=2759022 RepID=A0ABQ1ECE2_9CLOT|nr:hypothetical protein [Clostridium zeae]GFZ32442.1 hypothetical protein CSC2_29680 [Clostridium zeae]